MRILAIETSCDDTAAAVLDDGVLVANVVSSQLRHREYGGVVPEIASRDHQRYLIPVVQTALETAEIDVSGIDAIAATFGPGLAGSLLVGLSFAKALAAARDIPFVAVNHLDGHLFSAFPVADEPSFPAIALVVSGGHTELLRLESWGIRTRLGRTRDDAAGEAFDKVGKILGLEYPGGPAIESAAKTGNPQFHRFPRTTLPGFEFSFSGIKTSVLYHLNAIPDVERDRYLSKHTSDIAACFQSAMVEMIVAPLQKALRETGIRAVALSGGVSANALLRSTVSSVCEEYDATLRVAPPDLRTDNAAMIAMVAYHLIRLGQTSPLSTTINPAAELI